MKSVRRLNIDVLIQTGSLSTAVICVAYGNPVGYVAAQLVEAMLYKPEGRGFKSRLFHWKFSLT